MKKFLISLLWLLMWTTTSATLSTTVNFDFSKLRTVSCQISDESFTEITYEGLENISSQGEYSLPVKTLFFSVPYNAGNFTLEATGGNGNTVYLSSPVRTNIDENYPLPSGDVMLGHIVVPANATLIVEANTIGTDDGDDKPLFMPGSNVQLISRNGQRAAVRSRVAGDPHMVVEGRTWWYGMFRDESFAPAIIDAEFGVRIGEEIELNGKTWHKVDVVMTAKNFGGESWTYDFTPRTQVYVREDNGKVYAFHTFEGTDREPYFDTYVELDEFWRDYYNDLIITTDEGKEVLLYVFGEQGDSYSFGSNELSFHGTIEKVGETQSAGNTFRTYSYVMADAPRSLVECINYIDGIGTAPMSWGTYGDFSDLFYAPGAMGVMESGRLFAPCLRYVTDSSNNVIYEGIGGVKIWEKYNSVTDITSATGEAAAKWYNLQGVEIAEPATPGVYVKVVGNTATKVVVK